MVNELPKIAPRFFRTTPKPLTICRLEFLRYAHRLATLHKTREQPIFPFPCGRVNPICTHSHALTLTH
jgi:hypothetical protein